MLLNGVATGRPRFFFDHPDSGSEGLRLKTEVLDADQNARGKVSINVARKQLCG
jgi:hypothetical protein